MENKRIYLSSPHMSNKEMRYVKMAFSQNWVAPLGPNVDAFEEKIKRFCEVKDAAVLSSGTAAIHLALILLGIKSGDEVITSTFTFSATVNPIIYQNAIPIFIDSELHTWNMDPLLLRQAIIERLRKGSRPKAIIVVHLYGMPANMEEIMNIANEFEIPVIEDAAEALGSRFKGRPVGTFGKIGVISFNGNKIITTSGGGAMISNDISIIKKARFLATQARDSALFYQHSEIGYNYRLSNVLAGIGIGQLEVINDRVQKRRSNFNFYKKALKSKGILFLEEPNDLYFSNHWLTTIILDKTNTNWANMQKALEQLNIESRPLWKPMHLQPVFSNFPKYLNGTSEKLFSQGLCLPSGSNLSSIDRSKVVEAIIHHLNSLNQ